MKKQHKAINMKVTQGFLNQRINGLKKNNWSKSKWIYFCEELMRMGFIIKLYEARQTKSKYCTVVKNGDHRTFKVRFSDHKPNRYRELNKDCDFFVGYTHTGIRTTHQAIDAVCKHFNVDRNAPHKSANVEYISDFVDTLPWED